MRVADAATPRWHRAGVAVYLSIRVSALGFTWMLPLLGLASATHALPLGAAAVLLTVALGFHVFAYVLNDVVDLWVDRSEPLRADSPLVRGDLQPRHALWLACGAVPFAFAIAAGAGASQRALVALGLAFTGMTMYDLYGKRCRWPWVTDAVQALAWALLLLFGALFGGYRIAADTAWAALHVFVNVMLVNGLHGGLRDLANDRARGACTTAVWMGARATSGGGVAVPLPLFVYAALLQGALIATALATWLALAVSTPAWSGALVAAALALSCAALLACVARRSDRRAMVAAGAWHIVATLLVLPAIYAPAIGAVGAVLMLAALLLPVAAMFAYNGSHWRMPAGRGVR